MGNAKSEAQPDGNINDKKNRGTRSPASPSYDLEKCVENVRKIYTAHGHGNFTRTEIAVVLGFSAASGPFSARIFSLKEYGLIQNDGDGYRVTEMFKELNSTSPGSTEFKRLAFKAFSSASLFSSLLSEFRDRLPTRGVIATRLELGRKFQKDRAVELAKLFDEGVRFAGVVDSVGNISVPRGESASSSIVSDSPQAEVSAKTREDFHTQHFTESKTEMAPFQIPLGPGRTVTMSYPKDMSASEATLVGQFINLMINNIIKNAEGGG